MENIKILDGAMGTLLWERTGERKSVWQFNLSAPEQVRRIHEEYIEAGSSFILSNTFTANGPQTAREHFDMAEVVRAGVRIAKEAAADKAKVAFDIGPLTAMMEPYGDMSEDEAGEIYAAMLEAGMKEDPDCIWFETFIDLNMLEVAVRQAMKFGKPVYATMAFEKVGKTIMGNSVEDMIECLSPYGLAGIGLNCNLTPELALPVIRRFRENTNLPLVFKPNAGKPVLDDQGNAHSGMSAELFAKEAAPALQYASFMGGCCGTSPDFVAALKKLL